ncbi:phosphate ABC transporter permease PstA [Vallitalea okinawensis]|uniref:phosphate ABC transporter permease PstA n=1 Tax=Vallitalea okinawensis TaxID=2078660 RepID=UPI000CFE005A|nr:phosphate ABC transporter permease PstA [Vallitalea okinawensis]
MKSNTLKSYKERLQYLLVYGSAIISFGILLVIVGYIFYQGVGHLSIGFLKNDYDSKTVYATVSVDELGFSLEKDEEGNYVIDDITNIDITNTAKDPQGNEVDFDRGDNIISINMKNIEALDQEAINQLIDDGDGETLIKLKKAGGGIFPMIITTLIIIVSSLIVAVPIGIFSAIYLTEYAKQGKLIRIIRFSVECLAGIPSIIYGLFGMLFFVTMLNFNYSVLSGALTISIVLLPIIIRTTEESLKTVPMSYREASLGLGGTKIQTIMKVIIPSALPGIMTAVILSIGRIIGESAALLLTAGTAAKIPDGLLSSGSTLTVKAYLIAKEEGDIAAACAIGVIIISIILLLNLITKMIAKRRQAL